MARGDLWPKDPSKIAGHVQRFLVKAGAAASIKSGEPVLQNTGGDAEYVVKAAADVTTSDTLVGIAMTDSTDTASVDGYVDVWIPDGASIIRGYAKTKGSLASTVRLTKVIIDLTSGTFTIDESTTTNGFMLIVDYDADTGIVDCLVDMTETVNA